MKPLGQKDRIVRLGLRAPFTRMDAVREAGVFELASRIGELEAEGCTFHRKRVTVLTRYGGPTSVTEYTMFYAPSAVVERAKGEAS